MFNFGPRWSAGFEVIRHGPQLITRGIILTGPGIYMWFRNGKSAYVEKAKGAQGLSKGFAPT